MKLPLRQTFRLWWQKPRNIAEAEEEREISFLELFYDLAYVGIVFQLTHAFVAHIGVRELLIYVALYAMTWFAWINGTFYHELHGNNDIRTRIMTFLQVFALSFMAIFAHNAFGEGAAGFALSYAAFLAIVTYLWWRTGVYDPNHRPMSGPYTIAFLVTTAIFIVSAFVAAPLSYYLWAVAIVFSLLLPFLNLQITSKNVSSDHRDQALRIRPAVAERFGLLTIIVLGEVVASVMRGAAVHEHFTLNLVPLILLGLLVSVCMWWTYFDLVARRLPVQQNAPRFAWMYLHLPITLSIALSAAGLLYILEHPDAASEFARLLVVGPVALFLISLSLIIKTLQVRRENSEVYNLASLVALIAAIVTVLVGFSNLSIVPTLLVTSLLMLAPVYSAFRFWITRAYNEKRQAPR